MSPFRLFGRPDTGSAADVPPAEHAAWYGVAADPPPRPAPAYRPPHSGGSSRRQTAYHASADATARGWGPGGEHHSPAEGRGAADEHRPPAEGRGPGDEHRPPAEGWGAARGGTAAGGGAPGSHRGDAGAAAKQRKARRGWGSRRATNGRAPANGQAADHAARRWGNAAASRGAGGSAARSDGGAAGPRGGAATTARRGAASTSGGVAGTPWGDGAAGTYGGAAGTPPWGCAAATPWGAAGTPWGGVDGAGSSPRGAATPWPIGTGSRAGNSARAGLTGTGERPDGVWDGPLTSGDPRVDGDPPTDPRGFPPVPAFLPAAPPHPAEAAALAGAFAVDYLSWDEDDPERRGRVLVDYLPTPGRDPARLGWTGEGRQRAEFALPGLVRSDGDGRVLVDVRVRVTPYIAVGEHGAGPDTEDARVPGAPAAAPAPTGRGWRSLASTWIRLSVPVTFDGGRMVVDAWDETLGEEPPPRTRPAAGADDHTLADDDPLQEPVAGGAR